MATKSEIGCVSSGKLHGIKRNREVAEEQHDALSGVAQTKGEFMTFQKLILALSCLISVTLVAQEAKVTQGTKTAPEAKVTQLLSKDLTNLPGKEGLMITVDYPPGSSDPIHRHNAHAFVYVLEGSIVMQVRGGKQVTLIPGQTFYEGPDDVHIVGRNASQTKPAKFIVFLVKDKGAPVFVPAK
jgi:quercetin dioxygenase-like cupin family protein